MQRILAAAFAAALLAACGGDRAPPPRPDAGTVDAGVDGGVDGGCANQSISGTQSYAFNNCLGFNGLMQTSVLSTDCQAQIQLGGGSAICTGTFSGPSDAFDGGCPDTAGTVRPCASSSIPGDLICDAGTTTCTIRVCDGGPCP